MVFSSEWAREVDGHFKNLIIRASDMLRINVINNLINKFRYSLNYKIKMVDINL